MPSRGRQTTSSTDKISQKGWAVKVQDLRGEPSLILLTLSMTLDGDEHVDVGKYMMPRHGVSSIPCLISACENSLQSNTVKSCWHISPCTFSELRHTPLRRAINAAIDRNLRCLYRNQFRRAKSDVPNIHLGIIRPAQLVTKPSRDTTPQRYSHCHCARLCLIASFAQFSEARTPLGE